MVHSCDVKEAFNNPAAEPHIDRFVPVNRPIYGCRGCHMSDLEVHVIGMKIGTGLHGNTCRVSEGISALYESVTALKPMVNKI